MNRRFSPALTLTASAAILGLALTACGSSSLTSPGPAATTPVPKQTKDDSLIAKLPAKVKAAGKIVVGTDATYAPNEFLDADGKTVKGMDVDLFDAVAQKFGLTVEYKPAKFESIITGVQGGKYDVGVSSFTINPERKAKVNMVSYFKAGTQWATAPGNPKKVDPNKPCGLNVAVQKGTTQEEDELPPKIKACETAGKPIKSLTYVGQDQATAAVATGKADAMLADSPVVSYAIKQSAGKLEAVGDVFEAAPYGYVVTKANTEFAQALADALKAIEASGDYKKALAAWGNEAGAISDFAVNP